MGFLLQKCKLFWNQNTQCTQVYKTILIALKNWFGKYFNLQATFYNILIPCDPRQDALGKMVKCVCALARTGKELNTTLHPPHKHPQFNTQRIHTHWNSSRKIPHFNKGASHHFRSISYHWFFRLKNLIYFLEIQLKFNFNMPNVCLSKVSLTNLLHF